MNEPELIRRLENLEAARASLQALENALQQLTPEERLIAHHLLLHPMRGNAALLCQLLNVEQATVYRRRKQILKKIDAAISGPGETA